MKLQQLLLDGTKEGALMVIFFRYSHFTLKGMGTHWSYDLVASPGISWKSQNLFPLVTMYNEQAKGILSAFFITTPKLQYSEPLGPWEGPIPSFLMCQV